jgi:hypothetical protein
MVQLAQPRRGLFGAQSAPPAMSGAAPVMTAKAPMQGGGKPAARRRGLFGSGINVWDIVGTLGDAVAINRGMDPFYAISNQQQRMFEQQLEQDAMQAKGDRQQRREDLQWEWANKPYAPNDTERDYEFWQQRLSPEEFERWKQNRVDPPQYRQGPDGQFYRIETQQAPPVRPVGRLTPIDGGAATAGAPPFSGSRLDQITMMAESGGNPNAVSPKGARGLMQVMPETARDPGYGVRPSNGSQQDDVRLGQEYRAAMERRYAGDPAKMWAAYNAGPGRVDEAIRRHGQNWLQAMPAETQAYIAQNLRALGVR